MHSGYTFRTRAILKAQTDLGWDVRGVTGLRHTADGPYVETVDGLTFYRTRGSTLHLPVFREWSEIAVFAERIDALCAQWQPDILHAHSPVLDALAGLLQLNKAQRALQEKEREAESLQAAIAEALRRAQTLKLSEALSLAEQYRRRANGVISDMIVANTEITEQDFMDILESGHPPGYTNFRDFIQGDYTYQRALFRAILTSSNADRGYIDGLRVTVDVPDVFDRGTAQVVTASSGVAVVFVRTFRVSPEVTLTFKGGTTVAIPRILGSVTTAGFTAILENTSGARVTGAISWVAQGY